MTYASFFRLPPNAYAIFALFFATAVTVPVTIAMFEASVGHAALPVVALARERLTVSRGPTIMSVVTEYVPAGASTLSLFPPRVPSVWTTATIVWAAPTVA